MICERCGRQFVVGDWPFCPHGRPGGLAHGIVTNESFIGGVTVENMGPEPVTVYSREEFNQEMARRGLEQRIKHVPGDKHLIDWGAGIDAQTLENARVLVERQQLHGKGAQPDPASDVHIQTLIRDAPKTGEKRRWDLDRNTWLQEE